MALPGQPVPTFFGAYGEWMATPPPRWEDVEWLRAEWDGPLLLKGITRVDDAKRAVAAGMDAISVSNHGGNNLDTTPATIRCLPAVADAVGDEIEVLLDGGVRRGSDVVKALALGARAVMIGRAYLWGLAANGQAGVENVLDILRGGIDSALLGLGHSSVHDLNRGDLVDPGRFAPGRSVASELASLTWPEVAPARPAGRTGGVDRAARAAPATLDGHRRGRWLCNRLAGSLARGTRRAAVAYGSSGEHAGFPGTLSIGQEVLELLLVELVPVGDAYLRARPARLRARRQC